MLKVDTEGAEVATRRPRSGPTCSSASGDLPRDEDRPRLHPGRFAPSFACDTLRLENRFSRGRPRRTVSSDCLERQPARVAREPARGRLAQRRTGLVHAQDRRGDVVRRGRRGHEPVDALVHELGRRVVRLATPRRSARRAPTPRRRSARSPRAARAAPCRAPARSAASTSSASTKPGALDGAVEALAGDRGRARPARSGPSPKITQRRSGTASRARRAIAGTTAGARFSGMWRPANTTRGSAGRAAGAVEVAGVFALEHGDLAPQARSPAAGRGAAARSRTRAAGCARTAAGWRGRSRRRAGRGTRASSHGSTPRASPRRARSGRYGRSTPAASSEKYGKEAVCTTSYDRAWRARCARTPAPNTSGGRIRRRGPV